MLTPKPENPDSHKSSCHFSVGTYGHHFRKDSLPSHQPGRALNDMLLYSVSWCTPSRKRISAGLQQRAHFFHSLKKVGGSMKNVARDDHVIGRSRKALRDGVSLKVQLFIVEDVTPFREAGFSFLEEAWRYIGEVVGCDASAVRSAVFGYRA
jgi:hypothetical protein